MGKVELADPKDFLLHRPGSGGTVEIFDIAVGSGRGEGKGTELVKLLFDQVPNGTLVWAITRAENMVAQQFYEALRFRIAGVLRNFYGDVNSADAIVYARRKGDVS